MGNKFKLGYNPILSYLEGNWQQRLHLQRVSPDPLSSYSVRYLRQARTEDWEHLRRGNTLMFAHPTSWIKWVWNLLCMKALPMVWNAHFFTRKHSKITRSAQRVPHTHRPGVILIHKVFSSALKTHPCHRHLQWQHCTLPVKMSVGIDAF